MIKYHALFFILTITLITPTTKQSQPPSIYETLASLGLPSGLFPKGITNFTIEEDGTFEVYLDEACDADFESELHYEKSVMGQLSVGLISNLSGISAQDLFLWFPVKGIRVDIPSSGVIYFDVGVVRKQFSVSVFESPRDCVSANSDPLEVVNRIRSTSGIARVLINKLGGVLRNSENWW